MHTLERHVLQRQGQWCWREQDRAGQGEAIRTCSSIAGDGGGDGGDGGGDGGDGDDGGGDGGDGDDGRETTAEGSGEGAGFRFSRGGGCEGAKVRRTVDVTDVGMQGDEAAECNLGDPAQPRGVLLVLDQRLHDSQTGSC